MGRLRFLFCALRSVWLHDGFRHQTGDDHQGAHGVLPVEGGRAPAGSSFSDANVLICLAGQVIPEKIFSKYLIYIINSNSGWCVVWVTGFARRLCFDFWVRRATAALVAGLKVAQGV